MKKIKKTKQTEKEIEIALSYAQSIITTLREPFLVVNKNLRIVSVNQSFCATFKITDKEAIGQLLTNLGNGQWNIPKLIQLLKEILPRKTVVTNYEIEHEFETIGSRIMNLNARRLRIPKRIAIAMTITEEEEEEEEELILLAIEDVSEKKMVEETKIKAAALEKELKQQKEIDKMKSEFVSLASHQLRTPLTSIKWYSEMLLGGRAGELTPKQKKYIEELYQGNERMIDLVRNLLNISRIEMGVLAVNPKQIDIGELIKEVIKEQSPFVKEKKHNVVVEISGGLPKISTDPELVRMIFQNLFGNAIEYTPAGGKITCTAEKKDSEIIIEIKDEGIGIPEKQQNQIFQKLFRGDNAVREHSGGTGLELYITKAMVDALSGKIWFKSKEGEGTTFWVALPLLGPKIRSGQKIIDKHYDQTK